MSGTKERFDKLMAELRDIAHLGAAAGGMQWDMETGAPPGSVASQSETVAFLEGEVHRRFTGPEMGGLLGELAADALAGRLVDDQIAVVRLAAEDYEKKIKIPTTLVGETARLTGLSHQKWVKAKESNDFGLFAPTLAEMIRLVQQKADCLGYAEGGSRYDALLDEFEPGNTVASVAPLFADVVRELSDLIGRITASPLYDATEKRLVLPAGVEDQRRLCKFVAGSIGFDWSRGRLAETAHPFCGGTHPHDVRMATAYKPGDLLDALFGTIHETGHAMYEQGLPAEWWGTGLGSSSTMSIHESQSRLWENNVGRSQGFVGWLHRQLRAFGMIGDDLDETDLYLGLNIVEPGFVRIKADEVTYGLHVCLRFEIERLLIEGSLPVADLPEAWDSRVHDYLGLEVPDARRGCLQDVHWSCGLFGYFPSYLLGSANAAQLMATAQAELDADDLSFAVSDGHFSDLLSWLRWKVHQHGRRYRPAELIERTTGTPPSMDAYLRYLRGKFGKIYGL